jgi:DNA-binding PadR family transcriptional regulator
MTKHHHHREHNEEKFKVLFMTGDPGEHEGPGGGFGPRGFGGHGRRNRRYGRGHEGGFPGFLGRGPRAGRGDVRAAILVLLAEQPYNGYGLMQEIESRSEGVWRPSPGSMYPVLAQLEDEALISAEETEGRKQYSLTEAGTAYVEENREKLGEPWAGLGDEVGEGRLELHSLLRQLAMAMTQVASAGTDAQIESARKILIDARKGLYRLLASDEDDE